MEVPFIKKNYQGQIRNYMLLTMVSLVLAAGYCYLQWTNFAKAQEALQDEQIQISTLSNTNSKFKETYLELKGVFDKDFQNLKDSTETVLPKEENYTELTRKLDAYVEQNHSTINPMFMSDLKFSEARVDKNKDFAVLPFTLTLNTTRDNLENFLRFIETSGSLSDNIRLMDVTSISISFATQSRQSAITTGTKDAQLLNVSLALNAYFQKPLEISTSKTKLKS